MVWTYRRTVVRDLSAAAAASLAASPAASCAPECCSMCPTWRPKATGIPNGVTRSPLKQKLNNIHLLKASQKCVVRREQMSEQHHVPENDSSVWLVVRSRSRRSRSRFIQITVQASTWMFLKGMDAKIKKKLCWEKVLGRIDLGYGLPHPASL